MIDSTQKLTYTAERCGAAATLEVGGVRVFEPYPYNRFEDDIRLMGEAQQSAIYGRPLRHDNILIRYFHPGGQEMEFRNNNAKWPRKWQRLRFHPENQGAMPKYMSQTKSGVRPFFSALLACDFGQVIDTIYLTEGEIKAAYGCINGVPTVGIGGITSMCETQRDDEGKIVHQQFEQNLREFLQGCRARRVVMVYDADALTGNAMKANRASNFIASVRMFLRSAEAAGVMVGFAVVDHATAKGLDDLYVEEAGAEEAVTKSLKEQNSDYFQHYDDGEELIRLIDESSNIWWRASSRYGLQVNEGRLRSWLESEGFRIYTDDRENFEIIRVQGRILHKSNQTLLMQHVIGFIRSLEGEVARAINKKGDTVTYYSSDLDEAVTKRTTALFSEAKLRLLQIFDGLILTDTATQSFHFFRDKFAMTSAEGITTGSYDDMQVFRGYIWADWINSRELGAPNEKTRDDFDDFMRCICTVDGQVDEDRYLAATTIFGYLMHTYQFGKRYGVVLTDANSSEFEDNGRTGKSEIYCRALTYLRKGTFVQAKRAKFDSQFLWQSVGKTDQLVVVNDLPKGMGIDTFYNEAADAVTVEKKNKESFSLKLKLVLSTNSLPRGSGESVKDRFIFFAFQNYFSAKLSPADFFGRWLFADWDAADWSRFFYSALAYQVWYFEELAEDATRAKGEPKTYGIIRVEEQSTAAKQFIANTRIEFFEWLSVDDSGNRVVEVGDEYELGELLRKFQEEYQLDRVTSRTFNGWIRHYCRYIGYDYDDDMQVSKRKSGAKRYFRLVPKTIAEL